MPSIHNSRDTDTIAAVATAPGRGGIGIVRLSGSRALDIARQLTGKPLRPRHAHLCQFHREDAFIDEGLALYFPAPNSFTGEEVVELQGHGGPVVMRMLLEACINLGARQALPGEFSQRAFLNDRLDLTQVEAIADLIDAGTDAGVRAANRSLQGVFSRQIQALQQQLTEIRIYVEAAIDFPEEEVDFIADSDVLARITRAQADLDQLLTEARRGLLLREGARIAIVGRPNAGKSSLLNQLARQEVAIVTDIAGTTRDAIEQSIDIGGAPVTFIDTAGLNDSPDQVEKIGIERTLAKAADADILLFVFDASQEQAKTGDLSAILGEFADIIQTGKPLLFLANKSDLTGAETPVDLADSTTPLVRISAKTGAGIEQLLRQIEHLLHLDEREPQFSARSRHIYALNQCQASLITGLDAFAEHQSGELLAEDLRLAQRHLSDITGDLSADDLLGEIFAGFCIGK